MTQNKSRDELAEQYRKERNWPSKPEWIERKGDLDSRMSYEIGDYVEEAFCDGFAAAEKQYLGDVQGLQDQLDLMIDEFQRISALTKNIEIDGICERAISQTKQAVPVVEQRDNASAQVQSLKTDLEIAADDLEKVKLFHDHIIGKEKRVDWGASFVAWGIVNEGLMALDRTLINLKSKLGRGEK